MHTHEDRPLGVLVHITGTVLYRSVNTASILYPWLPPGPQLTKYRSNSLESRRLRWNMASRESTRCSMKVGRGVSRPMESCSFNSWAGGSTWWFAEGRTSAGTGAAVLSLETAGVASAGESLCPSVMVNIRKKKLSCGKENAWQGTVGLVSNECGMNAGIQIRQKRKMERKNIEEKK